MMADMMKAMKGDKSPMMGMMAMMMGNDKDGKGEMPWEMCKKMMSSISRSSDISTYATPEIRGLFEEWIAQIDEEYLTFIKSSNEINIEKIIEHSSHKFVTEILTDIQI